VGEPDAEVDTNWLTFVVTNCRTGKSCSRRTCVLRRRRSDLRSAAPHLF